MSDNGIRKAFGLDDEDGDLSFEIENRFRDTDDGEDAALVGGKVVRLMETVTRIGGEVCRLRAEVDGLLDSNKVLQDRFEKLRDVIEEKGTLNMDDFELACEVMSGRQTASVASAADALIPTKKIAH